jgi:hypothetical protein
LRQDFLQQLAQAPDIPLAITQIVDEPTGRRSRQP